MDRGAVRSRQAGSRGDEIAGVPRAESERRGAGAGRWRFHPDPAAAGVLATTARANVRKYLELVDNRLRGRDWLVDTRSIADPYLFVMLRWVRRLSIDSNGLDNVARFFERMQADRGVRAALTSQEGQPQ